MQKEGMRALIFGSTGAIGSELVAKLLASPKWASVHCVARKQPQAWSQLPNKEKLVVEAFNDLDEYFKLQNNHYTHFDSVFCCLGSQTKHGDETFIKIDKTYPLNAATIAERNVIPHYLLVSSMGSDPKSFFLYPRTKGEVEAQLQKKKLNLLTIIKPGVLKNRKDARTIEKFMKFIPFVPGIEASDAAQCLKILAQKHREEAMRSQGVVKILQNKELLNLLK